MGYVGVKSWGMGIREGGYFKKGFYVLWYYKIWCWMGKDYVIIKEFKFYIMVFYCVFFFLKMREFRIRFGVRLKKL